LVGRALGIVYYAVQVKLLSAPSQTAAGDLGQYIFAGIVLMYAGTIADWGLGTWLTREVAVRRHEADPHAATRGLFAATLTVRLVLAVSGFAAMLLVALPGPLYGFFRLTPAGGTAIALLGLSLIPSAVSSAVTAVYNAYERMGPPALIQVGTTLANAVLGIAALFLGWGAVGLAGAALVTTIVTAAIFTRLLIRDFFPPVLIWQPAQARTMLSAAFPLMVNGLLIAIFFRFDQFLIEHYRPQDVAIYETAYKVINVTQIITPSVVLALFPAMARAAIDDRVALTRTYRGAVKLLLVLGLPLVAGTIVLAGPLITAITLGKEGYLPYSAWALAILIVYLPLSFVNGVTQYVLIAVHRQGRLAWAIGATALFNVAANALVVPVWGIYGAAVVTVLSEVVLLVPFLGWTRAELGPEAARPGPRALKLAAAGTVLAILPAATLAVGAHPVLALTAGLLAYAAALAGLGVLSPREIALLRTFGRRGAAA
ncbi:MAG TPA: flippase, partial [Chloroflexia bacterium]|nr:flippase [Chloroflexia bacterium]